MDVIEEDVKAKRIGSEVSVAETPPIYLPSIAVLVSLGHFTTYRGCHMRMREIFHEETAPIAISFYRD
jgi:hypothetical protein